MYFHAASESLSTLPCVLKTEQPCKHASFKKLPQSNLGSINN